MPISPSQVRQLLLQKHDALAGFDQSRFQLLEKYRTHWQHFNALSRPEQVALLPVGVAGARPLEHGVMSPHGVVPFFGGEGPGQPWENRQESLGWARQVLGGITTFAVDGSQIFPSKDLSLPIALVQVGWFENPHTAAGNYVKDIRLEILTPGDLRPCDRNLTEDRCVHIRRFQMEVERLVEYIQACPNPERCLVFFDGALVVTFAQTFEPEARQPYVDAVVRLLQVSQDRRVPLVGYIDTSSAHDLTHLLAEVGTLPPVESIHDAQVLNTAMEWGDRTAFYQCDRGGILKDYGEMEHQVGFVYLKTTRDGYPARLEMPLWIWEAGLLETVVNWVRSEVVAGGGYPYAIETADQTAVLQNGDRQIFYRILQDWAAQEQVSLRFSRKMVSKVRRR